MRFLERFWFGCGHCRGDGHGCPVADSVDPESGEFRLTVRGPALVGTVILVFLVPPVTAIGGAYLAGHSWTGPSQLWLGLVQLGGAVAGFFVGVGLARLVLWTCRRFSATGGGTE